MNQTLTAVSGLRVGHATADGGNTGCTVLLGPFRAAVDIRGLATGTRELDALSPLHLVPEIDAIVLTGGSAPGLAAADGVTDWLRQRGVGFRVGPTAIPIVPAAVIFDIRDDAPPVDYRDLGRAACDSASADPVPEGAVGAGAGATVGKMRGPRFATRAGIGSWAARHRDWTVSALVVLNAFGDVLDDDGRIIAGARDDAGGWLDSMRTAASGSGVHPAPAANTTLCIVATDAPLARGALQVIARAASNAIVRRTAPANTVFDGDVAFAVAAGAAPTELPPAELLALTAAAQLTAERAIVRAAGHR